MNNESFLHRIGANDFGKTLIVRFLPNVDDSKNSLCHLHGFKDGRIADTYTSFALVNGDYRAFVFGRTVQKFFAAAVNGGYYEDLEGNLLSPINTIEAERYENEPLLYHKVTFEPFLLFDLKHNYALKLEITEKVLSEEWSLPHIKGSFVQDDSNVIYDGNTANQPHVKAFLQTRKMPLSDVVDILKIEWDKLDIAYDEKVVADRKRAYWATRTAKV